MASSNQRQRQLARAKFERQQARREARDRRARRRRRIATVVVTVVAVVAAAAGLWYLFLGPGADVATSAAAVHDPGPVAGAPPRSSSLGSSA